MADPKRTGEFASLKWELMKFTFIYENFVCGEVIADCAQCAWNEGHPRWPDAEMFLLAATDMEDGGMCISQENRIAAGTGRIYVANKDEPWVNAIRASMGMDELQ